MRHGFLDGQGDGLLVRNLDGLPLHLAFWDKGTDGQAFMRYYDATNPEAREYVWEKIREGYGRFGIHSFWLDACEPEEAVHLIALPWSGISEPA